MTLHDKMLSIAVVLEKFSDSGIISVHMDATAEELKEYLASLENGQDFADNFNMIKSVTTPVIMTRVSETNFTVSERKVNPQMN